MSGGGGGEGGSEGDGGDISGGGCSEGGDCLNPPFYTNHDRAPIVLERGVHSLCRVACVVCAAAGKMHEFARSGENAARWASGLGHNLGGLIQG